MTFQFFKLSEFACPCCNENEINLDFIFKLDNARSSAGVPFKVNSGYRCPAHNQKVGGVPHSDHLRGEAVDIATPNSEVRYRVIYGLISAGFTSFIIYPTFIHVSYSPLERILLRS